MALPFHPKPGTIVLCDYSKGGFRPPEMVKQRLAVIVSPKLKRRDNLASVVPLSTKAPPVMEAWHVPVAIAPPPPWDEVERWAKCDMIATVSYDRLGLPHYRHEVTGARLRWQHALPEEELLALRHAIASALGIVIAG